MSDDLIWTERGNWTPADPDSLNTKQMQSRVRARHMHADDVDRLRVERDPCGFCGVRADMHEQYGCGR